jgi:hypothetical protein
VAAGRSAVVVPGGSGGPATPLLGYAAEAAERRGARPYPVWWNRPGEAMAMAASPEARGPWASDWVRSGLARAEAPCLLVGGTADTEWWDGALARQLTPYVLEVAGADHRMMVPGPLSRSAEILGLVVTAVEEFLDAVVWR